MADNHVDFKVGLNFIIWSIRNILTPGDEAITIIAYFLVFHCLKNVKIFWFFLSFFFCDCLSCDADYHEPSMTMSRFKFLVCLLPMNAWWILVEIHCWKENLLLYKEIKIKQCFYKNITLFNQIVFIYISIFFFHSVRRRFFKQAIHWMAENILLEKKNWNE